MTKKLTSSLREKLKVPLGELRDAPDWSSPFITVGDQCTFLAAEEGAKPLLAIYDNMIMRQETTDEKRKAIGGMPGKKIVVDNPAGTITDEADLAIRVGLENAPTRIEVNGEEDLLVLPCVIHAKDGTAVYYGQPRQGIVKVIVNPEMRKKAKGILLSMKEVKQ